MSKYPGRIVTDLAPAGYSVFFDGTGDYLNASPTALGSGAFTIECWAYLTGAVASKGIFHAATGFNGTVNGVAVASGASGGWTLYYNNGSQNTNTSLTASLNTWIHIAVVKSGTTIYLYINGVLNQSQTDSANYTTQGTYLGGFFNTSYLMTGNISNFRITNTALYSGSSTTTANFNPPTQLLNISGTTFLTCNSPAIIDQSNNAFAITVNGNSAVSTLTPFTAYVPYNPALGASTPGVWTVDEAMQARQTRRWNMYDPYFNLTTLLLRSGSTDGSQNNTFLDSSSNNFTITRNPASGPNAPTQGSFSPFSQTGWGVFQSSASADYLNFTTSPGSLFQFTGDYTIEAWIFPTALASDTSVWVTSTDNINYHAFNIDATNYNIYLNSSSATSAIRHDLNLNQWNHVALVRSGSTVTAYTNGVSKGTINNSSTNGYSSPSIARFGGGSAGSSRYISNLRITKGGALYTANFTPSPIPFTTTVSAGTVSLLTCQSNRYIDNSSNALVATVTGTPSVQAFSPFYPVTAYTPATIGGSGYFDGASDYLQTPATGQFAPTGNWTISLWFYPTALATVQDLVGNYTANTSADWSWVVNSNGSIDFYLAGGSSITMSAASGTIKLNQWHFISVSRSTNTVTAYVNGSQVATASYSQTLGSASKAQYIGSRFGAYVCTGYICDVRMVDGQAVTAVPTAPTTTTTGSVTASNTKLLLNFTNAAITDATAKNVLETVGNAQASTSVKNTRLVTTPPTSMYFDGNGDYLQIPSSNLLAFGSSPYTVELWLYPNNVANLQGLFTMGAFRFFQNTTGLWFLSSSSTIISVATGLSTGQWFHIALVREGTGTNQTKLYLNGSSIGTGTDANTWAAAIAYVGSEAAASYLNGYLDDLRITRGFARYTAAFTPPRSRLQEQ